MTPDLLRTRLREDAQHLRASGGQALRAIAGRIDELLDRIEQERAAAHGAQGDPATAVSDGSSHETRGARSSSSREGGRA